jgi:hypothetical protein
MEGGAMSHRQTRVFGKTGTLKSRQQSIWVGAVILTVYVAAQLWHLTSFGIFGDEVFTLWTVGQDWNDAIEWVIGDVVHPPLYYALLKLWVDLGGQSLLWIKLLPVLFSIATLLPLLLLCRELKLDGAATSLALWLAAVNGFLITHAQEIRMYSLLLLLTVASLWLFAKLPRENSRKTHAALFAVNLLLVYTHYFGLVVVTLELAFLLIWRREALRPFVVSTVIIACCFSPWVYLVARAAKANPSRVNFVWNRPPALSEMAGYYGNLNGPLGYRWKVFGATMVMLLFIAPIVVWGSRRFTEAAKQQADPFRFLTLFAFAPAALAFVGSHVLPQPVWAFRYLIIAAPAYLLLVATASSRLKSRRLRMTFMFFIAGWSGLSGLVEAAGRDRVAWGPLVHRMIESERFDVWPVAVFAADPNVGNTIQFYLDQAGETRFRVVAADNLNSPPGEHSWVGLIRYNHESQPPLQDSLGGAGYVVGDVIEARASGHRAMLIPVWKPGQAGKSERSE